MQKRYFLLAPLTCALIINSCTVATSPQAAGTLPPATTTQPNATQTVPTSGSPTPYSMPITWSALHLSGKLIYAISTSDVTNSYMDIQELDLVTGGIKTIFQSDPNGWIDSVVISPDSKIIILIYSPPAAQKGANLSSLTLTSIPMDGSQAPRQLFPLPSNGDQALEPAWSPDGMYLYFVLVNNSVAPAEPNQHFPIYRIYRAAYPNGQLEQIAEKAYWPRISADGSRLVYVSENPDDGTNKLFVANSDGSHPTQILLTGANAPTIIDAPVILPDGKTILFNAPTPLQSSASPWLDWLFGVIQVSAHSLPSEWFSAPLSGGAVTQLTHIRAAGLYAAISPDRHTIASFSGDGLFVMKMDGTDLTMLVTDTGGNLGTVSWIP